MDYTQYLHLSKPDIAVDHANINDLNGNMDIIDTALHETAQSEGQVISETLDGSTDTYTGYALFAQGTGTLETSKHTSSVMLVHTEDSDRLELTGYVDISSGVIDMINTDIDGDVTFRGGIVADGGIRAGDIAMGSHELRADNATGYFGSIITSSIDCSTGQVTGYSGYFDYEVHGKTGYFDNLYVNGEPVSPGGGFDGYFPDPVYFQDTIHVDNYNHSGSIKFTRTDSSQTLIDFTGYHDTGYITGVDEIATLYFAGSSDNHNYIGYLDSNNIDVTGDITKTVSGTTHTYRTIEANPSGTATDTLTSVNIGGTVYDIGGGNTNYQELTQAEYDALTEAEKTNGTLYFITDGEGGGSGSSSGINYSTTEQRTGQKWIDGKDIYVRAFDYVIGSSATTILANCGFETLVKIEGCAKYLTYQDPLPHSDSSDYILPRVDNGDFIIQSSSFFISKATGTVVAYYTKITD